MFAMQISIFIKAKCTPTLLRQIDLHVSQGKLVYLVKANRYVNSKDTSTISGQIGIHVCHDQMHPYSAKPNRSPYLSWQWDPLLCLGK